MIDLNELPGLSPEDLQRIEAVWNSERSDIRSLIKAGNLDPQKDFRYGDFRGWNLAGEDVRGIDFTGSDLRGTAITRAIRDSTTILKDARVDDLDELVSDGPQAIVVETPKQAKRRVYRLLNEASERFEQGNREIALNLVRASLELIKGYEIKDFPSWSAVAFRAFISLENYATSHSQASSGLKSQVLSILARLADSIQDDREIADALLEIAREELRSTFANQFASEVLQTFEQARKNLKTSPAKWDNDRIQFALLEGQVSLHLLMRDLSEAENQARNLIKMANLMESNLSIHTNPDYPLRAVVSLGGVLLASGRGLESVALLTGAVAEASQRLSSASSVLSIRDFFEAITLLIEGYELVGFPKEDRKVSELDDCFAGVDNALDLYRPVSEWVQIVAMVGRIAPRAKRNGNEELFRYLCRIDFRFSSKLVSHYSTARSRSRLATSMLRYARSARLMHDVGESEIDAFQLSVEVLRQDYRLSGTVRAKGSLIRALKALTIVSDLTHKRATAERTLQELKSLEAEDSPRSLDYL